ncbi:unnamed protein product, partial [Choristocarpus tenellus]
EAILSKHSLLGGEGSAGACLLSGQAMVRLYLVRMLLEVVTLPGVGPRGAMAAEGVYVAGIGSPCHRRPVDTVAVAGGSLGVAGGSLDHRGGAELHVCVGGCPPVLDIRADGIEGVPSPMYVGREKVFWNVCTKALRPDWFISLLETCGEEAGLAWTFRLLAALFQASEDFVDAFEKADGFRTVATSLPRFSTSLPVLLPALALALGVPIRELPPTAEGMGPKDILSMFRRNAGIARGPSGGSGSGGGQSGEDIPPHPFVRLCVAEVLIPSLRSNGIVIADAAAGEGPGAGAGLRTRGTEVVCDVLEVERARRVNEVVLGALWEAQNFDPSFARACRSPDVVEALVDALGASWDEQQEWGGGWGQGNNDWGSKRDRGSSLLIEGSDED